MLHEGIHSYNRQLRVVRARAIPYTGQQVGETDIAERDCLMFAIERDRQRYTEISPMMELADDDQLFGIGRDKDIDLLPSRVAR